jgi:hypothetical protein
MKNHVVQNSMIVITLHEMESPSITRQKLPVVHPLTTLTFLLGLINQWNLYHIHPHHLHQLLSLHSQMLTLWWVKIIIKFYMDHY